MRALHQSLQRIRFSGALHTAKMSVIVGAESEMPDPVEPLILDLLEWIGPRPKAYREVIDVWRTSCPRLPVWEEANTRGFLSHSHPPGAEAQVAVSTAGQAHLLSRR